MKSVTMDAGSKELRMPRNPRDYKQEYRDYQGKKEQIENRSERNKARREAIKDGRLQPGSKKEVDHKKPLSKDGSNAKSNTRIVSRTENRRKYNKDK